jgi:hypothetical protein
VLPFPVELLRYFEAAAHAADSAVPRAGIPDREPARQESVPDLASAVDEQIFDIPPDAVPSSLDQLGTSHVE